MTPAPAEKPWWLPRDTLDDSWIQTYTGRQYWPHAPRVQDVDLEDIAHALSNLCRYTGHCRRFYSVAEHCCWVSVITGDLDGLLHDAHEAYVNDIATPVKRYEPAYKAMEELNAHAVAKRFQIAHPTPKHVKDADRLLYWYERRELMLPHPAHPEPPGLPPCPVTLHLGWSPEQAKANFLARFNALSATR